MKVTSVVLPPRGQATSAAFAVQYLGGRETSAASVVVLRDLGVSIPRLAAFLL